MNKSSLKNKSKKATWLSDLPNNSHQFRKNSTETTLEKSSHFKIENQNDVVHLSSRI